MLALKTLNAVGGFAPIRERMPVNVKKFPSTMLRFLGTRKSVKMSGSLAVAILTMAYQKTSNEKSFMVRVLEAMEESFEFRNMVF